MDNLKTVGVLRLLPCWGMAVAKSLDKTFLYTDEHGSHGFLREIRVPRVLHSDFATTMHTWDNGRAFLGQSGYNILLRKDFDILVTWHRIKSADTRSKRN